MPHLGSFSPVGIGIGSKSGSCIIRDIEVQVTVKIVMAIMTSRNVNPDWDCVCVFN